MTMTVKEVWSAFSKIETHVNQCDDLASAMDTIFAAGVNREFETGEAYVAVMRLLVTEIRETARLAHKGYHAALTQVADADRKLRAVE